MATHLQIDTFVNAPPERVFALATDFEHAAERVSAIVRMEMLTDGPVGLGTRFRETRVMFKREATEEMTVVEWEPPLRYVLGAESCGSRYRSELRCTPEGEGTRFSMSFEAEPQTFFAKVMGFLMKGMIKKMGEMCLKDLEDIGRAAEAERAGS